MNGLTTPVALPRIGGQIEEAAPTHSVKAKDRLAIMGLLVLATAVHGWLLVKTQIPARDGLSFSRLALQIESPSRIAKSENEKPTIIDVLKNAEQPPGFPLIQLAVSKVVRVFHPVAVDQSQASIAKLGEVMLTSGQIACCLGGILTVIPVFLLGRLLGGRFVGFAAAVVFQVLPVASHVTSDCLSEGCFLLTLLSSLWLAARGLRRAGLGNFLVAGLLAGLTYLIRPEGLLIVGSIGTVVLWQGLSGRWTKSQMIGCLVALLVGVSFIAVPFMLMIGGITNKPSGRGMLKEVIFGTPREQMGQWDKGALNQKPAVPVFAEWASDNAGQNRVLFAFSAVANETFKTGHYVIVPFAIVGLISLARRMKDDPATMLTALFVAMNITLLVVFAAKIGYVSERHTLPIVAALSPFAAIGIHAWLTAVSRFMPFVCPHRDRWIVLLIMVAVCLPSALKPLHSTRIGLKKAGEYLGEVIQPGDTIVDPFSWSEFYSGASVLKLPVESEQSKTLYTVMPGPADPSKHDRLPKMPLAKQISASGKVVYSWPETVDVSEAKVLVYKTTR